MSGHSFLYGGLRVKARLFFYHTRRSYGMVIGDDFLGAAVRVLSGEVFTTLAEARGLTQRWREDYNQTRPHSTLGYQPPAPEVSIPVTLT